MATRTAGRSARRRRHRGPAAFPYLGDSVILDDGAGGTVRRALTAADTRRVGQGNVAGGGDAGIEAAVEEAQRHTFWSCWQTWMQRPQVMHLRGSSTMLCVESSLARSGTMLSSR